MFLLVSLVGTCQGQEVIVSQPMCCKLINVLQLLEEMSSKLKQDTADDLKAPMKFTCSFNELPSKSIETCAGHGPRLELSGRLRVDQGSMFSRVINSLSNEVTGICQHVKATSSALDTPTFLSVCPRPRGLHLSPRVDALRRLQRSARAHKCRGMWQIAFMLEIGHAFPEIVHMIEDEVEMIRRQQMIDSAHEFSCEDMRVRARSFHTASLFSSVAIEAKGFVDTEYSGKYHRLRDMYNNVSLQIQQTKQDDLINRDAQKKEMGLYLDEVKAHQRSLDNAAVFENLLRNTVDDLRIYYGKRVFHESTTGNVDDDFKIDIPLKTGQVNVENDEEVLPMAISLMEEVTIVHALLHEDVEDVKWGHWRVMTPLKLESASLGDKLAKLNHIIGSLEMGGSLSDQELSFIVLYMETITTGCDYDAESFASRADSRTHKLALLAEVEVLLHLQ